jgi:hypothetical protein
MYEHHKQPLAKKSVFAKRLALNGLAGLVLLSFSLGIGVIGYHFHLDRLFVECIHDPRRDGSGDAIADSGWKIICFLLCVVFRCSSAGWSGYSGGTNFSPLPASFPPCRR